MSKGKFRSAKSEGWKIGSPADAIGVEPGVKPFPEDGRQSGNDAVNWRKIAITLRTGCGHSGGCSWCKRLFTTIE